MLRHIQRVGRLTEAGATGGEAAGAEASRIGDEIWRILGRAVAIRLVVAGSCNGCEHELNALGNPYYNVERLGIRFVASPRHADLLLVTGPVTKNMEHALKTAHECMPAPKRVVAIGDCGASGGLFGANYASCGAVANVLPVDVVVPGCPPTPLMLLQGILAALRL